MDRTQLPLGFGMALAMNEPAMREFAAMTEAQRQAVLEQTHYVKSRQEMRQLVEGLRADD